MKVYSKKNDIYVVTVTMAIRAKNEQEASQNLEQLLSSCDNVLTFVHSDLKKMSHAGIEMHDGNKSIYISDKMKGEQG